MNKFIVIEGLDGSGKTTITKMFGEKLTTKNIPCHTTFEPTNNPIGRLIRQMLSGDISMENETAALLFAADRYEHLTKEIIPTLKHSHVICDRYYYSNIAYQGLDAESLNRVISYNREVMNIHKPDAVFFLDISPEECMRRILQRGRELSIYETQNELELRYERYQAAISEMEKAENVIKVGTDTDTPQQIVDKLWSEYEKLFCS